MAVYVNQSALPKDISTGTASYSFAAGGYAPAGVTVIAELAPYVTSGELIARSDNWLVSNPTAPIATRTPKVAAVSLSSVAEQLAALQATVNQIEQEAYETEKHLHNHEYTFGLHPAYVSGVTCGTRDTLTPYTIVTGLLTVWGSWYCLLGSQDTPVNAGYTRHDPHRIIVTDASVKNIIFKIQFAEGEDAAALAAAVADNQVSEFPLSPLEVKTSDKIKSMIEDREHAGVPFWTRLRCANAGAESINMFLLMHEYLR